MILPNFIIFGVAKAGTTSLYHYLDQHPQVFMSSVKETNFFANFDALAGTCKVRGDSPHPARFPIKTLTTYAALFAGVGDEIAIGEASPRYFRSPNAPQRIREFIPDMKLVACLRNPADRAFSGFLMRVRKGHAKLEIQDRLTPESHHVTEGFYYRWLRRYFDVFPKQQIKVCIFEQFKKDPAKVVAELFDFLGVHTDFLPDMSTKHNRSGVPKNRLLHRLYSQPNLMLTAKSILPERLQRMAKCVRQKNLLPPPAFPTDLRAELLNHYREDILNLELLLDLDLSDWLDESN